MQCTLALSLSLAVVSAWFTTANAHIGNLTLTDALPCFGNHKELSANAAWASYFRSVYGTLPSSGYNGKWPLCVGDIWMFYDDKLTAAGISIRSVGKCPSRSHPDGEHYQENNMYSPPGTSWLWHGYPYAALPDESWVEVVHEKDPFGDEHFGAWFAHARGSGVWFNLGKTIAFQEHGDACLHFGADGNEKLCQLATKAGFDSMQFLAHIDHVNYPCDKGSGLLYMNIEFVAVSYAGTYDCIAPPGAVSVMRAGWLASKPCACDTSKDFSNCDGSVASVPSILTANLRSTFRCYEPLSGHHFLTTDPNCNGIQAVIRDYRFNAKIAKTALVGTKALISDGSTIGHIWQEQSEQAGAAVYDCLHGFISLSPTCEGTHLYSALLGYVVPAQSPPGVVLRNSYRCYSSNRDDHLMTADPGCKNSEHLEGYNVDKRGNPLGAFAIAPFEGSRQIFECLDGDGRHFSSADSVCEQHDADHIGIVGYLFHQPTGAANVPIYRCYLNDGQGHMLSRDAQCEGVNPAEKLLGYAFASVDHITVDISITI